MFECLYKQWINKGGFESEFKLFNSIQKSLLKDNRNLPKNQVILHSDSNIGLYSMWSDCPFNQELIIPSGIVNEN